MTLRILSSAERDLAEAVDYYNDQRWRLGFEFADEVRTALERIEAFADAWPSFSERSRRYILRRFPYGVLYQVRGEEILIVAIMHLRRHPRSWRERLNPE